MKWIIFSIAALFYFLEFIIRLQPSIIIDELMGTFDVSAGALGFMSSFYFYAILPTQLIAGVIMDWYGARKPLIFASILCTIGNLFFGMASKFWMLLVGRMLMGVGSAFGFVGLVYIISHWFPKKSRAKLIAFGNSIGLLGAVFGQGPTRLLINFLGWRQTSFIFAFFGVLISLLMWIAIQNQPKEMEDSHDSPKNLSSILEKFVDVVKHRSSWLIGFLGLFFYTTTVAFAGLWAVRFFVTTYEIPVSTAGFASSMVYLGMLIGGPFIGHYYDKHRNPKKIFLVTGVAASIALFFVIYYNTMPAPLLFILMFIVGFFSSSQVLIYNLIIEANHLEAKGMATAFANTIVLLGGAILQPLVGIFLDIDWDGQTIGNIPIYNTCDYHKALIVFPLSFLLGVIIVFFIPRKKAKPA